MLPIKTLIENALIKRIFGLKMDEVDSTDKAPISPQQQNGGDEEFGKQDPKIGDAAYDESLRRQWVGAIFLFIGLAAIISVTVLAVYGLRDITEDAIRMNFAVFVSLLSAHSVVSIAIVWFGYQALRAAERMFVPQRLMNDAKFVDVIRAIVGIDGPTTAATKQLEEASKPVLEMAKAIAEIVGKAQGGGTKTE